METWAGCRGWQEVGNGAYYSQGLMAPQGVIKGHKELQHQCQSTDRVEAAINHFQMSCAPIPLTHRCGCGRSGRIV